MLERLKAVFHQPIHESIRLRFELDLDDQGYNRLSILKDVGDGFVRVTDPESMMLPGYHEEIERASSLVIQTLTPKDQQLLYSLKSMNPDYLDDGTLVFEIVPPILNYLRKNKISETVQAKELSISIEPLTPTVQIDLDPENGLIIKKGYQIGKDDPLLESTEIRRTSDGRYARIGNSFVPINRVNPELEELLNKPIEVVPSYRIPEFFQRDFVLLKKDLNAVLIDQAQNIRIVTEPMQAVVSVTKDPHGWLDFNISYDAGKVQVPYSTVAAAHKCGDEFIQIDPTTWVKIDENSIVKTEKQLAGIEATPTESGFRVPAYEFATVEEFIDAIGGRKELDRAYQEFITRLTGFVPDSTFSLPQPIETYLEAQQLTLRPYQRGGIQWVDWLRKNHLHGILADDMGLGKTLQALAALRMGLLEDKENKNHSLIVAPKSVLIQWEREINRVFPFVRVCIFHGQSRNRSIFQSSLPYIVLTTYETLTRDAGFLSRIPFYYLILDEATRIKNPDSRRTQAIKSLNAEHRLALSGTPVENKPTELWSLFDFLMKGHLGKYSTFERIFQEKIAEGDQKAVQRLGRRVSPFLLRRKKEDVAKDLPEKIPMTEWVNLTAEQRNLYGVLQDEAKGIRTALREGKVVNYASGILPILTKLKQVCDHPALITRQSQPLYGRSNKFDFMIEKIEEIVADGEQVVVFSHFLDMLSLFQMAMQDKGVKHIRIDGSTNNRQALIDSFNLGNASVAFLSLMATGYGINMTSANHVIHADRWWNPAVEDQATDRVHRIGQNKTVYVYQVLNEGTLEEKIDRLLNSKRGIADQIIRAASQKGLNWSREELLELLAPLD